jgi:phosphatidylglycerophosphate synthase
MLALAADLFTLARVVAAGILIWLGFRGPESLPVAVGVLWGAWTTDQLDGWAARRANRPTRLGAHEFPVDVVLYAGELAYLTLAGFVPKIGALAFAVAAIAAGLIYRRKSVVILFLRMIDLAAAVILFTYLPRLGLLIIAWVLLMMVLYRKRLAERVPRWLGELARLVVGR